MKKRKGFTLIELIAVLAVFSIISLAITSFLNFNMRSYSQAQKRMKLQEYTSEVMGYCSDYAKQSSVIGQSGGWYVFSRITLADGAFVYEDIFFVRYDAVYQSLTLDFNSDHSDGNEIVYNKAADAAVVGFSILPAGGAETLAGAGAVDINVMLYTDMISYSGTAQAQLRNR